MLKRISFLILLLALACSKEPINYTLKVNVNPPEGGFVNPDGGTVPEGQQISLVATTADEFIFDSWSGAATGTSPNVSIIMDANKVVTANFIKKKYTLTVNVEGEGEVIQKIIKAGTATDYNSGTIVELTASTNVQGWQFKEWKGDLSGTKNPIEITIDKPKSVTAVFERINVAYLDENGVTIKANNWAKVGDTAEINGETYTIVDLEILKSMIHNEEDVTKVVTSLITDMSSLFQDKNFDQDISSWDVSNVENMNSMFANSNFNKDISLWDVSNVTDMGGMIGSIFNGDISNWKVGKVTNMQGMFAGSIFNGDISNWDVSSVENMSYMFYGSRFNQDIGGWDVSNVKDMQTMFKNSLFNGNISNWNVSNVEDMSFMFQKSLFNQEIGDWDVSSVKTMEAMFELSPFNQAIGDWDVSMVENYERMFNGAGSFNQDIGDWNIGEGASLYNISFFYMFGGASEFNQDIGSWDVSKVVKMDGLFEGATLFDQDLTSWCVSVFNNRHPNNFSLYSALSFYNRPQWGECPENSYKLLVKNTSSSDYTLSGKDKNGTVSGEDPDLTFKVGDVVRFFVDTKGHPFYLKTSKGTGNTNQISTYNNGSESSVIIWVPKKAGTYYYQCSTHTNMVGTITIVE